MKVREASVADLPHIQRLYAQLNPDDPPVTDDAVSRLAVIIAREGLHLLLGTVDDKVVSTCYVNIVPNLSRGGAPYAVIENVVTEVSLRNRGYGQELMQQALAFAWAHGCYKVMLQTGSRRETTHNFYKACGFAADDKFAFVARPPAASKPRDN